MPYKGEDLPPASAVGFVHHESKGHLTDRGGAICDARKSGSTNTISEHTVINCACFCA
jgi:hypothetical protein